MGEKEKGAARESSTPSVSERKAGEATGKDVERGAGMTHEDDWEAPASLATGDLDGDGAAEAAINNSHSNIKNLAARPDPPDDDSDDDGLRGDARSNGLPPGQAQVPKAYPPPTRIEFPARVSEGGGGDIAIGDPGVNGN
ncbi:MAG: hypothetical protein ABI939_08940 [Anaerolineaceae bacterium]